LEEGKKESIVFVSRARGEVGMRLPFLFKEAVLESGFIQSWLGTNGSLQFPFLSALT